MNLSMIDKSYPVALAGFIHNRSRNNNRNALFHEDTRNICQNSLRDTGSAAFAADDLALFADGFTEGLTFMMLNLAQFDTLTLVGAPGDAALRQVVGRHFHGYLVPGRIRMKLVRSLPGDKAMLEMSYDLSKGAILALQTSSKERFNVYEGQAVKPICRVPSSPPKTPIALS